MASKTFKPDDDLTLEERQIRLQERQQEFQERQLELQEAALGVQRKQLKQTEPKSLMMAPNISPFNLRGQKDYPNPRLKCEVYAPWRLDPNLEAESPSITREEAELYNLLEPGEFTVKRNDGSPATCCVVGVRGGTGGKLERLSLLGAKDPDTNHHVGLFTNENKQLWPDMPTMLRQILTQARIDHSHVMTMEEEAQKVAAGKAEEDAGRENPYPVSVGA